MNIGEFLSNSPGICFPFDVMNDNPDYILYSEEKNNFYVSYYNDFGSKVNLMLSEIWGYYDGFGIFINYKGKPYELMYLGAISIVRYEHFYKKNMASQAVSLIALGGTITGVEKMNDIYLDLKNDIKFPRKDKYFKKLIEQDKILYKNYEKDKKTGKQFKSAIYLELYNSQHPVLISAEGIIIE
jgi:hypothetical protein